MAEVSSGSSSMWSAFDELLVKLPGACEQHYGTRLVSLAVFGSVGRGTQRPTSDIDVLLVVDDLPIGRMPRMGDFAHVERLMAGPLAAARARGVETDLSPVFRTPAELSQGSLLLLDMTEDARILADRGALSAELDRLRRRLDELGARRIFRGNAWFWDLKPDYRPGDVFSL